MRVSCSKGTYIRTFVRISEQNYRWVDAWNLPAHPRDRFLVKDSLKLDQIEALRDEGKVGEHICSLEEAFRKLSACIHYRRRG